MISYIVFGVADVFEENAIAQDVVIVEAVTDLGHGVFEHIIVDIQLVDDEVYVEDDADAGGDPALDGAGLEIDKFDNRGHEDVHQ
jgi:hypothetical protein